jgi:hypothetical protein
MQKEILKCHWSFSIEATSRVPKYSLAHHSWMSFVLGFKRQVRPLIILLEVVVID